MSTYSIEHAKSGRSKCKKCKEPIPKGALRIGVETEDTTGAGYTSTSWTHPKCFNLPRKLKQEGVTAESFVEDTLRDDTANDQDTGVLQDPQKVQEIIADIEYTKPRASAKKKKRGEEGYEPPADGTVAKLKEMRESMREGGQGQPPAKKPKFSQEDMAKVDIYGKTR